MNDNHQQIIPQILALSIPDITATHITYAIDNVNNKNDLNEIINYIFENKQTLHENDVFDDFDDFDEKDELNEWGNDEFEDNNLLNDDDLIYNEYQQQINGDKLCWRCHKCDTWYMDKDYCLDCLPKIHTLYKFQYRGHKSGIVTCGFFRMILCDSNHNQYIGVELLAKICLNYLIDPSTCDNWTDLYHDDLLINPFNRRLQYKTYDDGWRSSFSEHKLDVIGKYQWKIKAVDDISTVMIGMILSSDAVYNSVTEKLSLLTKLFANISLRENEIVTVSVDTNKRKVILSKTNAGKDIELTISDNLDDDALKELKLAVSLCKQYDAVEIVHFEKIED